MGHAWPALAWRRSRPKGIGGNSSGLGWRVGCGGPSQEAPKLQNGPPVPASLSPTEGAARLVDPMRRDGLEANIDWLCVRRSWRWCWRCDGSNGSDHGGRMAMQLVLVLALRMVMLLIS